MQLKTLILGLASVTSFLFGQYDALAFPELSEISEPDSEPNFVYVEGREAAIDANSIQWDGVFLKVITVSTEYEALVIYDCQKDRFAEIMVGDGIEGMEAVEEPVWNERDPGFVRAVCNTAYSN